MTDLALDRNLGPFGKYVVLRSRDGKPMSSEPGADDECYVLLLKDEFSQAALLAYAHAAEGAGMPIYAEQIRQMARRAGPDHRLCKRPD